MSKVKNIFDHTDCISEEMLMKYVSNKLSPAEKHEVEKHLTDCEMCSDAVEGLKMVGDKDKISNITSDLNKKIKDRMEKKEVKIISLGQYRTQLALAASIILIVGLVWFFKSNMKELDPGASEKIFADKFEPYKTDKDEKNNVPVTEAPALNKSYEETSAEAKSEMNQIGNSAREDKKTVTKEEELGQKGSREAIKAQEGFYNVSANASPSQSALAEQGKKSDVPVLAEPESDAIVLRDESLESDKQKNESVAGSAPQKSAPVTTISTGSSANVQLALEKNKANDNRALREEEKKQQNAESMTFQTQSKSEKDRSKSKKSAEPQPAQQRIDVTNNVTANEQSPHPIALDSAVAGSAIQSGDAGMAMKKYEQKDYSGAVEDFEKTLAKDPDNYNALFYSSVSYLSTGETDKAITNLNKVLEKKDGEFYDAAQWYLSLAYIKKNDTQNARRNLVELQKNSKSKYQKQADETLKEMRK